MEILFKNKKLQKCCSKEQVMIKELGPQGARKLKARLADLQAATDPTQVQRGRPHQLTGDFRGCLAFHLDGARRLVIEPATDPAPVLAGGGVDWSKVDTARVVFIGDYHG